MKNTSGLWPVEYKVVVLQDEVEEVTEGGIILPQDTQEKEQFAQVNGVLVAAGGMAFTESENPWSDPIPEVGNRIMAAKYAGTTFEGKDGKMYCLCNDKDIAGIWEE